MPMVFTLRRNFPDEIERLGARVNSEKMLSQHQQRLGLHWTLRCVEFADLDDSLKTLEPTAICSDVGTRADQNREQLDMIARGLEPRNTFIFDTFIWLYEE